MHQSCKVLVTGPCCPPQRPPPIFKNVYESAPTLFPSTPIWTNRIPCACTKSMLAGGSSSITRVLQLKASYRGRAPRAATRPPEYGGVQRADTRTCCGAKNGWRVDTSETNLSTASGCRRMFVKREHSGSGVFYWCEVMTSLWNPSEYHGCTTISKRFLPGATISKWHSHR